MGQAIRLRTLTEKSIINFGNYNGLTVGMIIDLKKGYYLRWVYYNCSNISFMDNILDKIDVIERIEKPGKNKVLGEEVQKMISARQFGITKIINKNAKIGITRAKKMGRSKRERIYFSRSSMQSRNHGH